MRRAGLSTHALAAVVASAARPRAAIKQPVTAPTGPLTCGECTLCCKVLDVPEIQKPKDVWCQHAHRPNGCSIYPDRPERCRTFSCLWLLGRFGAGLPEYRPDRIHAVPVATKDGLNWVLHEDPGYARHARTLLRSILDRFTKDGSHYVVVVCGAARFFIGSPAKHAELTAEAEALAVAAAAVDTGAP
jgi:hypothetical protein